MNIDVNIKAQPRHTQGHDTTFTDDKVCKRFHNLDPEGQRSVCVQGYREEVEQGHDIAENMRAGCE